MKRQFDQDNMTVQDIDEHIEKKSKDFNPEREINALVTQNLTNPVLVNYCDVLFLSQYCYNEIDSHKKYPVNYFYNETYLCRAKELYELYNKSLGHAVIFAKFSYHQTDYICHDYDQFKNELIKEVCNDVTLVLDKSFGSKNSTYENIKLSFDALINNEFDLVNTIMELTI